ncbi:MAG TPA: biotin synthase BioB [Polyangia bacterium]|nr:biotin synthase BioB [Polyangia bacterium]
MSGIERARQVLELEGAALWRAVAEAAALRERRHGRSINLCWIVNARSGDCGEDCAFCAQSARSDAAIQRYGLLPPEEIIRAALQAAREGAVRFSIVTSGRVVKPGADLDAILEAVRRICGETSLSVCASLGVVEPAVLAALREAGVSRYHHNLETAPSHWPAICTTRPYEDSRRVIRDARDAGLEVCSGGIIGLGESLDQRAELLGEIDRLGVESVALNFFVPVPGTPLAHLPGPAPLECLRVVVAARLLMPDRDIRVCGGRERNLRDLQAVALAAGVSGMMIGGYLTTPGRAVEEDLRTFRDIGLEPDTIPEGRSTLVVETDRPTVVS